MTSSHKDYREEKKVVNGRKGLVSETGSLNRRASGLFACLDEPICASLVLLVFVFPPLQRESVGFGSGIHDKYQCIILRQRSSPGSRKQ